MRNKILVLASFSVLFLYNCSIAQIVSVPLDNEIYNYLTRGAAKGYITLNDETRPWSRIYVAGKLLELRNILDKLTTWEKESLEFYEHEYYYELVKLKKETINTTLKYLTFDYSDRFRFFFYEDSNFTFSAEPMLGYEIGKKYGDNQLERHNGINIYGSFSDNIGISSNLIDNLEEGLLLDANRTYSNKTGFGFITSFNKSIEYDYVNASIDISWKWGNFGIAKDYIQWGSGESGQLIFSTKAPSFPFIRLKLNPVDWFEFNYIHGWLNSTIIDSSGLRYNFNQNRLHYSLVDKFIASHLFTFRPLGNLSISVGESVVYSDKIQPVYFIPFLFFRLADHYVMNNDNNVGGNAQIFADIRYKNKPIKSIFYFSLFIDELAVGSLFNSASNRIEAKQTELAYTIGGKFIDPFLENSEVVLEYTKIEPYVYSHSDDAQFYSNYKYQLGHWIGNNGDLVFLSYIQNIQRGLKLKIWGEYLRRGKSVVNSGDVIYPYPDFLYGNRENTVNWGIEGNYEIIYSLNAKLAFQHSKITDEDLTRTPSYQLGIKNLFSFSLSYGF